MRIKLDKYSNEKKETVSFDLVGIEKENTALVAQVLRVESWNTANKPGQTKTRSDVRGGGKKPWRQKGTGRARAGSIRSPLWKGGGVTFGPTSGGRLLNVPLKMKQKAFLQAFVAKNSLGMLAIMDNLEIKSGKTKDASALIAKIFPGREVLLVIEPEESKNILPFRNISFLEPIYSSELRLKDLLSGKAIIFSSKSIERIMKERNV